MLILGDNPFFGINHASVARAQTYRHATQSRDWSGALATIEAAIDNGVRHLMMTAHTEAPELLGQMAERGLCGRINLIPAVPYLHRLNGIVATKGIPAALLQSADFSTGVMSLLRGASIESAGLAAFLTKETEAMGRFGFKLPYVALQNIFVDLLLGLGQAPVLNDLARALARKNKRMVAITMNPVLADQLLRPDIVVCTHYNYLGYMVQPDLERVRSWLGETKRDIWAMGVMASGRADLATVQSDSHLYQFKAVVLGSSRPQSISRFASGYALHR